MKRLLLLLFALVSFTACKKSGGIDPQPKSLADKFAGTYTLTSFRYLENNDGVNLPELPLSEGGKSISGTVTLAKKSDTKLDLKLLMKATGNEDITMNVNDLEARQVGSEYGLFANDVRVADVEGTFIIFNYSNNDPQTGVRTEIAFNAKR